MLPDFEGEPALSPARKSTPTRKTAPKTQKKTAASRKKPSAGRKKQPASRKRKSSPRSATAHTSLKPALVFLALAALLVAGIYLFFNLEKQPAKPKATRPGPTKSTRNHPQKPPAGRPTIKIYLPDENSGRLQPLLVRFNQDLSGTRRARAIIRELTRSRPGTVSPLPDGTKVLEISFKRPLIILNLSRELSDGLKTSGAQDEITALSCLTNSILANFPGYSKLQLLIDGRRRKTLAGHIDISRPLGRQKLSY